MSLLASKCNQNNQMPAINTKACLVFLMIYSFFICFIMNIFGYALSYDQLTYEWNIPNIYEGRKAVFNAAFIHFVIFLACVIYYFKRKISKKIQFKKIKSSESDFIQAEDNDIKLMSQILAFQKISNYGQFRKQGEGTNFYLESTQKQLGFMCELCIIENVSSYLRRKTVVEIAPVAQSLQYIFDSQMLALSRSSKILKTFIVQDERSQKVKIIAYQSPVIDDHLYLRDFICGILSDFNVIQTKIIKTYDFVRDKYINIDSPNYSIPLSVLHQSAVIIIKLTSPDATHLSSNPSTLTSQELNEVKSQTSSLKKERSKERVIFQVIEIVKKWREIHLSKNNLKKISLQEAAKIVGLPKKSLDDYYYQLRLGEKYDFNFREHLFDRIGVLRTYLKNLKESEKLDKNEKHPKKLKIIDQFDQIQQIFHLNKGNYQPIDQQGMDEEDQQYNDNYAYQKMKMENQVLNEQASKGIQNHFYSEFEYLMNEQDPFLAYDYNFKKKGLDEGDSGDVFL